MTPETLENGCQCPAGHPPCGFCTSMTEEEAEVYASGGIEALSDLVYGIISGQTKIVQKKAECTCSKKTIFDQGCIFGYWKRNS